MQDLWWQLRATDAFTLWTALAFAGAVAFFIHEMVGSSLLAVVSAPLLTLGGILAPTLLAHEMITLSYDRTVNATAAAALGTVVALLLILAGCWLWTLFIEWRVSRTRLPALPPAARSSR